MTSQGQGLKSKLGGTREKPVIDTAATLQPPSSIPPITSTKDFLTEFWNAAHDSVLWADRQYVRELLHPQLWSQIEFELNAAERAMSYSHVQHQMLLLLDQAIWDEQTTDQIQAMRLHIATNMKKNRIARARLTDTINCLLRSACSRRSSYSISSDFVDWIGHHLERYCEVSVALDLWILTQGEQLTSVNAILWQARVKCLQFSEQASDALRQIILRLEIDAEDESLTLRQQVFEAAQSILEKLEVMSAYCATETADGKEEYHRIREDMMNYEALMDIMMI